MRPAREHRRRARDVHGRPPKLSAYVHKEVTSAAARLDQFLSRNGVAIDERVTVISDDAGESANGTADDDGREMVAVIERFRLLHRIILTPHLQQPDSAARGRYVGWRHRRGHVALAGRTHCSQ